MDSLHLKKVVLTFCKTTLFLLKYLLIFSFFIGYLVMETAAGQTGLEAGIALAAFVFLCFILGIANIFVGIIYIWRWSVVYDWAVAASGIAPSWVTLAFFGPTFIIGLAIHVVLLILLVFILARMFHVTDFKLEDL